MSTPPMLLSATKMHAHKCQACAKAGKEVVWIHPDTCRGNIAVHTCPECGKVEWKQDRIESGKLPQPAIAQPGINLETVLGYIVLAVAVAAIGYAAFLYVKQYRAKKAAL
jgi:predicted RNA-binding Zn-ribbon protein involved in translation (DUF1610 family)